MEPQFIQITVGWDLLVDQYEKGEPFLMTSRVGRSDFGVNAARVRRYLQALRAAGGAG
jgi:uncharacterized protein (DUF1499 family)